MSCLTREDRCVLFFSLGVCPRQTKVAVDDFTCTYLLVSKPHLNWLVEVAPVSCEPKGAVIRCISPRVCMRLAERRLFPKYSWLSSCSPALPLVIFPLDGLGLASSRLFSLPLPLKEKLSLLWFWFRRIGRHSEQSIWAMTPTNLSKQHWMRFLGCTQPGQYLILGGVTSEDLSEAVCMFNMWKSADWLLCDGFLHRRDLPTCIIHSEQTQQQKQFEKSLSCLYEEWRQNVQARTVEVSDGEQVVAEHTGCFLKKIVQTATQVCVLWRPVLVNY